MPESNEHSVTKKVQAEGLRPYEIVYLLFLAVFFLAGEKRQLSQSFAIFYGALILLAVPLVYLRYQSEWRALPNKSLLVLLLAALLLLFQYLGNSTFGYIDTPSLFLWMYNAYTVRGVASDDGHGLLIPFVVLCLFCWKRKELLAKPLATWWPGLLLVALSLALHVVGYVVQQPRVSIVGLFTGIYGLMGLAWGPRWLRASFFPFFLLVFMMPLGSLTEPVTFPLRLFVSKLVASFCHHVLGISVISEGTRLLKMPWGYEYEVAAACSGIRSLVAISALAIIYSFVVFRSTWKRALLIVSAVPLAVVGNSVRLLMIVLAAEFGGQKAGAAVHETWYWSLLPYVPAIIGLFLIGRWLENRPSATPPVNPDLRQQPTLP